MEDLWSDDIEDEKTFSDAAILRSVRELIKAGQRESTVLDYKKDLSEKDNWPQQAAAFANTAGGVIIFGVECQGDLPRRLTGFDSQNVEIKAKITNMLLSRIRPRPEFHIRVVAHDEDATKEVAVLRVSEGSHPPYLHSKDTDHDIYIREGTQKSKADYLQLSALFEKRLRIDSQAQSSIGEFLNVYGSLLNVRQLDSNNINPHSYKVVIAPDDNSASRRLSNDVEQNFKQSFQQLFTQLQDEKLPERMTAMTSFSFRSKLGEQRFGIRVNGSIGFATSACVSVFDSGSNSSQQLFMMDRFCQDLIHFVVTAALYYKRLRCYSSTLLHVSLNIPSGAQPFKADNLFAPALDLSNGLNGTTQLHVALQPLTGNRLQEYVESLVNDLARTAGSVTNSNFGNFIRSDVDRALNHLSKS